MGVSEYELLKRLDKIIEQLDILNHNLTDEELEDKYEEEYDEDEADKDIEESETANDDEPMDEMEYSQKQKQAVPIQMKKIPLTREADMNPSRLPTLEELEASADEDDD